MITEVILFSSCLGLGIISRLWYRLLMFIEKKMNNRPASIVLEFFTAGIIIFSLVLLIFVFNGGLFVLYSIIGLLIGFFATSIFI